VKLYFRWVREERPGERWQALFERSWPGYGRWFLGEGDAARPDLATSRRMLARYMPELVPVFERLVELADGDEVVARMLALWRPAPYVTGCTQVVGGDGGPVLVRNYDYHPAGCEGTFLLSRWRDTAVLVSSDCLWGALDGMNGHGLAVSLAFGGRRVVGEGFGIPLILRYVLETCRTTVEAAETLARVPSHMAYNVSVVDAVGESIAAFLGPDRPPVFERRAVVTNHHERPEWPEYEAFARSEERRAWLEAGLLDGPLGTDALVELFLQPPLRRTAFERAFGTLYTTAYRPRERSVRYAWPGCRVDQSFASFEERDLVVPGLA